MPPIELAKTSINELNLLPRAKTVFFFPVGPMEDHGPHLPLGLDLEEATRLCWMAAERLEKELSGWSGVVMPSAPLGIDSNTTQFAIRVRGHVLRDWLVDSCRSLTHVGFKHFVCFSGHIGPKQLTAIEDAGKKISGRVRWGPFFSNRPTLVSACSGSIDPKSVKASPFWPDPQEHGGKRDTSVALAIVKERVPESFKQLPIQKREESFWTRGMNRLKRKTQGYWGEPSQATAAEGERVLKGNLDTLFPKLRAVWEGANPEFVFRSWYSVLPPNKSFFRAWLLAILLAVMLVLSLLIVFQATFFS